MVPTLFGSARDTSFSAIEVGAGMNTIATMATAAIKPPMAIIPSTLLLVAHAFGQHLICAFAPTLHLVRNGPQALDFSSRDYQRGSLKDISEIEQASLRNPSTAPIIQQYW